MGIFSFINISGQFGSDSYPFTRGMPDWLYIILVFSSFFEAVALLGVYLWKKLAVFAHLIILLIPIIVLQFYTVLPPAIDPVYDFLLVAGLFIIITQILYFWSIRRKWKYFE